MEENSAAALEKGEEAEEVQRCKRSDGKGWRCSALAMLGYNMCERHHQQKLVRQNKRKMKMRKPEVIVRQPPEINERLDENANPLLQWLDAYLSTAKEGFKIAKQGHQKKRKKKPNLIQEEEDASDNDPEIIIVQQDERSSHLTGVQIMEKHSELEPVNAFEEEQAYDSCTGY